MNACTHKVTAQSTAVPKDSLTELLAYASFMLLRPPEITQSSISAVRNIVNVFLKFIVSRFL